MEAHSKIYIYNLLDTFLCTPAIVFVRDVHQSTVPHDKEQQEVRAKVVGKLWKNQLQNASKLEYVIICPLLFYSLPLIAHSRVPSPLRSLRNDWTTLK